MGMRLLPKSEVDRRKADEKRREIDEGLKLARKIDNLREVLAKAEQDIEKFRSETIRNVNEEITPLVQKKDSLTEEVRQLEIKRAAALRPIADELERLDKVRNDLQAMKFGLEVREQKVIETEQEVDNSARKASKELLWLQNKRRDLERLHNAAADDREAAKKERIEAKDARFKVEEDLAKRKEELTNRESLVEQREKDATILVQEIAAREKELADSWTLLKDREGMLARDYQRMQNHGRQRSS